MQSETAEHCKRQLARLQHAGRLTSFETNVYYYLRVLQQTPPEHLCGRKKPDEMDNALAHAEAELLKLEAQDAEERAKREGGGK